MRFAARTLTEYQWLELMQVAFGVEVRGQEQGTTVFEMDDDDKPEFYCDSCDRKFNGQSQDLDDAPKKCPKCRAAPGPQALTVTYGKGNRKKIVTFPFFAPRPETEWHDFTKAQTQEERAKQEREVREWEQRELRKEK